MLCCNKCHLLLLSCSLPSIAFSQEFTRIESAPMLPYQKRIRLWQSMLSDRTLAEVRRERLNYTQLLYR